MSDSSKIEWCSATWNPVTGCDDVSPGCQHCYARTFAERWRGTPGHHFEHGFDVTLRPERLGQPLHWTRPRRIFVNSMSDLFHESVPDGFIAQVWNVMGMCPEHTFIILTKRHARMRSWVTRWADRCGDRASDKSSGMPPMPRGPEAVRGAYTSGRARLFADMLDSMGTPPEGFAYPLYDWIEGQRWWPKVLPNVWLGCSAEDQKWAGIRIPALLATPAAVRFISAEPLLGPIDLTGQPGLGCEEAGPAVIHHGYSTRTDYGTGSEWDCDHQAGLDWVIAGGESGPGARPCDLAWLRSLALQCERAQIPFFCKQLGRTLGTDLGAGPKGGDWDAWPEDLRIRQFPNVPTSVPA
jgi:protein gp37